MGTQIFAELAWFRLSRPTRALPWRVALSSAHPVASQSGAARGISQAVVRLASRQLQKRLQREVLSVNLHLGITSPGEAGGHSVDSEGFRLDDRNFVPGQWTGDPGIGYCADTIRGCDRPITRILVCSQGKRHVVPLSTRRLSRDPGLTFDLPGKRKRGSSHLAELPEWLDSHGDVDPPRTRSLEERLMLNRSRTSRTSSAVLRTSSQAMSGAALVVECNPGSLAGALVSLGRDGEKRICSSE